MKFSPDVTALVNLGLCNKFFHEFVSNRNGLWLALLHSKVPHFPPFELIDQSKAAKKLKNWISRRKSRWEIVGHCRRFGKRFLHRCAFDAESRRCFIFGGDQSLHLYNDLWELKFDEDNHVVKLIKLDRWEPASNGPQGTAASAVCIMLGDIYVFGGVTNPNRVYTNKFWRLTTGNYNGNESEDRDLLSWESLVVRGASLPPGRWGHTMVSASTTLGDFIVLFGGSSPGITYGDLWIYTPAHGWVEIIGTRC